MGNAIAIEPKRVASGCKPVDADDAPTLHGRAMIEVVVERVASAPIPLACAPVRCAVETAAVTVAEWKIARDTVRIE